METYENRRKEKDQELVNRLVMKAANLIENDRGFESRVLVEAAARINSLNGRIDCLNKAIDDWNGFFNQSKTNTDDLKNKIDDLECSIDLCNEIINDDKSDGYDSIRNRLQRIENILEKYKEQEEE